MCHECDDSFEYDDELDISELLEHAPEEFKEEFFDYAMEQMGLVMQAAEKNDVLFEMLTEWPRERISAFEMAVIVGGKSLDDDGWNN
jgi:hypothetical protein